MRIPILLMAVTAVTLSACDSRDDGPEPLPVGVSATVDGQPFRAIVTMGWTMPGTAAPLSISGATVGTDAMQMILLTVPARVGTYTAGSAETSAVYMRTAATDTTAQMWIAGEGAPGTSLEIRVTAVDDRHAEGTFAFTARPAEDASAPPVVVTGGTFNVALGTMPPDRAPGATLGAMRAFERDRFPAAR